MSRLPESENTSAWHFLVLRSRNLQSLRPEKSWRPVVTIEVDERHSHELVLGVDGQNPNLKAPIILQDVHEGSVVNVKIWHKSQSKSKRRKRQLVASAALSLGEIVKRQGDEPHFEVRLSTTVTHGRKASASKQKAPACLLIRIRAPWSPLRTPTEDYRDHGDAQYLDGALSDAPSSSVATPTTARSDEPPPWDQSTDQSTLVEDRPTKLRRRRPKPRGYCLDSDAALTEYTTTDDETDIRNDDSKPIHPDPWSSEFAEDDALAVGIPTDTNPRPAISIVLPSFLPMSYIPDNASVASSVSAGRSFFDLFTYYRELRDARVDSDFERVLGRLISEWYYVGASLLAVAALDTAVFGFSPDAIFSIDGIAKRSVTISSIACAIGLAMDAWFIFAYTGADVQKFQTLAVDVYSSFFFFSLTSRLPLVTLLVGVLSLVLFLLVIAWDAWPTAVLVMSCVAGVLFALQFIVYGCHRVVLLIVWVLRGVFIAGMRAWAGIARVRRSPPPQPPAPSRPPAREGWDVVEVRSVRSEVSSVYSVDVLEQSRK